MAVSLAAGPVAALLLALAPFVRPGESEVLGAVLLGLAFGWALLAVLSARLTDQPQRWAAVPAAFLGLCGLLLVILGSAAQPVLDWVWPPALLVLVIWMTYRVRRGLRSRSRYWLLYPVFALLALAAVGGAFETVGRALDARAHPMPGRLIDVGGRSLHLNCAGSGAPTVVLEAGGGGMSSHFGWIAPAVTRETRVCVYDRAGYGWSPPAEEPQDGRRIATDLHTLLHRADVTGPYVLAGHSFGGLYVQTFAALYPDETAGLVLIDSTAPATASASASDGTATEQREDDSTDRRLSALASIAGRLGVGRALARLDFDTLPPASRDEARAHAGTATRIRTTIDEYGQAGSSAREAAKLHDLGGKPLIVVTAGSGSSPGWPEKQDAMAGLSTNSAHRVIAGATHDSLITDEKHAGATARAIRDVVESVRTGLPPGDAPGPAS